MCKSQASFPRFRAFIYIKLTVMHTIPSHVSPVYCFGHVQTGVPSLSIHVPPFLHGFGSQLFVARQRKLYVLLCYDMYHVLIWCGCRCLFNGVQA